MALFEAVRSGSIQSVRELLNQVEDWNDETGSCGVNLDAKDENGQSALHIAADMDMPDLVDLLLQSGATANCLDKAMRTPLYLAAEKKYKDVLRVLICGDFDPMATSRVHTFHLATENNDTEVMEELLFSLIDVDERGCALANQEESGTALQVAAQNGHVYAMELLLWHGANVDAASSPKGLTALHLAAAADHAKGVEVLLNAGANVNKWCSAGQDALMMAVCNDNIGVTKQLLSHGASTAHADNMGMTALLYAVGMRNLVIINTLLDKGAPINHYDNEHNTALFYAVKTQDMQLVSLILDRGGDIHRTDKNGHTVLLHAIREGNIPLITLLLTRGANAKHKFKNGQSALHSAVELGSAEIVAVLIDHGVDVNDVITSGVDHLLHATALHLSAAQNHEDIARILLKHGAKVNMRKEGGQTPLHLAFETRATHLVDLLLQYGADVTMSCNQETCLHMAVEYGHVSIIPQILQKGVNINDKQKDGYSALYLAVKHESPDIVKTLLEHHADPNAFNHGKTALHYAVSGGLIDIVDLLLKFGADCEHQDADGLTPLYCAVMTDSEPMLSLLLSNGANIRALCRGVTILTLARTRYHPEVVDALRSHIKKRQHSLVARKADEKVEVEASV